MNRQVAISIFCELSGMVPHARVSLIATPPFGSQETQTYYSLRVNNFINEIHWQQVVDIVNKYELKWCPSHGEGGAEIMIMERLTP